MSVDLLDTATSSIEVYTAPPELGGTLTNASTVVLTVTYPDGTTATPAVVNTSTGKYKYDFLASQAGRTVFRWVTTGPNTAYVEEINVEPADPGYIVSLAQAKAHLGMTSASPSLTDEELRLMVAAATTKIEDRVGPVVRRTILNERHYGNCSAIYLHEAPVLSVTTVLPVAGGTGVTAGLLDVDPDTGRVAYLDGYSWFPAGVYFWTYVAGRTVVHPGLQLVALNYIKGSWETQRGASGLPLQGGGPDTAEVPGMGLVNWRLEQDLVPFKRLPGIA